MRYFSPVFSWTIALCCFFMLVAANGLVMLYDFTEGRRVLSDTELTYEKKKVSVGLGCVALLMIALKMMSKIYYRERLLPGPVVAWLDQFYFPAFAAGSSAHAGPAVGEEDAIVLKEDISMGIHKMKLLALFKIATAAIQFALWAFPIGDNDFVWIMTLVVHQSNTHLFPLFTYTTSLEAGLYGYSPIYRIRTCFPCSHAVTTHHHAPGFSMDNSSARCPSWECPEILHAGLSNTRPFLSSTFF